MNTLQELIKHHLKANGYTIYSISQQSGINRTTLQKMLATQRKFTKEIYETLLNFFTLTADEKEELNHAFLIDQIGLERFQTHMEVKHLLETSVSTLYSTDAQDIKIVPAIDDVISNGTLLHNSYQIIVAINSILSNCVKAYVNPFLYTYVDITHPFMTNFYKSLYGSSFNNLHIQHLIEIKKKQSYHNQQTNIQNIRIINSLLSFFTSFTGTYTINYYYSDTDNFEKFATIFPFYFITDTHIILLSHDFETALFLSDKSVHEYFMKTFRQILSKSYTLTDGPKSSIEVLNMMNLTKPDNDCKICMNIQPTIEFFITPSMIDKYLLDIPYKDIIRGQLLERIKQLNEKKHTIIFTLDGLNLFVEQGKCISFPDSIAMHFDIKDRIYMLNKLVGSNKNETQHNFLLLNPAKIHTSLNLSIATSFPSTTCIFMLDKKGNTLFIPLQENTLYNCFTDFIQTLPEYGFVYSIEETNNILEEKIHQLKNSGCLPSPPDSI